MPRNLSWRWVKYTIAIVSLTLLFNDAVFAKRPQILPDGMLINVFALTEASAALKICAKSNAFVRLTSDRKNQLQRLQTDIDSLVKNIAAKYDEDLFPFFVQSRDEAAARPNTIKEMQTRYAFCNDQFFERMKGYVADSRQKLNYFLSQQPNAR